MRNRNEFVATAPLVMPVLVQAVLRPLAQAWTAGVYESLPSKQRNWRSYDGEKPIVPAWPLESKQWKVVPGGIEWRMPGFQGRAIAIFKDHTRARAYYDIEQAGIRRAAYLMEVVPGEWVVRFRFQSKEGMVERTRKSGWKVWVEKPSGKRRRRRWWKAPDDWPRDSRGPLSDRQVAWRKKHGSPRGDTSDGGHS